jgi:hypothetical protein
MLKLGKNWGGVAVSGNVLHVAPTTLLEVQSNGKTFAKARLAKGARGFSSQVSRLTDSFQLQKR